MNKLLLKSILICLFSATHAARVEKPTLRTFIHYNANAIACVVSLVGATAVYSHSNNAAMEIIRDCAGFVIPVCAANILFEGSSGLPIKNNQATPQQMFFSRIFKITALAYCYNSITRGLKADEFIFTNFFLITALARNTLGLFFNDVSRTLKVI
jgi:hypothetical protein